MAGPRPPFNRMGAETFLRFFFKNFSPELFEHYKLMRKAHRSAGRRGLAKGARMHRNHLYRLKYGITF